MFLYRDTLKRSLAITWRHKYLWFFGLFAAALSGAGSYNLPTGQSSDSWIATMYNSFAMFITQGVTGGKIYNVLSLSFKNNPAETFAFLVFFIIIFVLCLFLLWLAIVSQTGLINNSAKIIKASGKKEKTTINEGIQAGVKNFWPVLGYNLISAGLITLFLLLVGLPLIFISPTSGLKLNWIYSLLFFVFVPISLIIYFLCKYAVCFTVLKKKNFVDSMIDALKLFGKNWLISLEMAAIFLFVDILTIIVVGLVIKILAIPFLFIISVLAAVFPLIISQIILVLGVIVALLIVVLAGSIVMTFKLTAWTDVFINLAEKKSTLSKIVRITNIFKK